MHGENGKFKYIKVISNLKLDADNIVKIGARRWSNTEIEFRRFKHEYGLKLLFLKDPAKFWPLLLLVLISNQLLLIALLGIHKAHGGNLQMKQFLESFSKYLQALVRGDKDADKHLVRCDSAMCNVGRNPGERIK